MYNLKREEIFKGINFNSIIDNRFKTNKISINLVTFLNKENASMNALIPNILRKGYAECPDFTEFNKKLDELYGASLDYGVEKIGDYQIVSLSLSGIDDKFTLENEELIGQMTDILSSLLLNPVLEGDKFPKKEIELECKGLIDTIKAEINEKRLYALNRATAIMCEGEPHGVNKYGDISDVEKINEDNLTLRYYDLLKQSNIEILFVGCGNPQKCKEVIEKNFASLNRDTKTVERSAPHLPLSKTIDVVDKMQVSQSKMVLGFSVDENLSDAEIYAMIVLTAVYGGTPMSKLFLNVREKLSLCYYCAGRFDRTKRIMRVDCGVENENIEKAKLAILEQLNEIKEGNITDEEISNAVMSLNNSYKTISDHTSALEAFYLAQILRNQITSPEKEIEKLKMVSKRDIIDVSKKINLDVCYILTSQDDIEKE